MHSCDASLTDPSLIPKYFDDDIDVGWYHQWSTSMWTFQIVGGGSYDTVHMLFPITLHCRFTKIAPLCIFYVHCGSCPRCISLTPDGGIPPFWGRMSWSNMAVGMANVAHCSCIRGTRRIRKHRCYIIAHIYRHTTYRIRYINNASNATFARAAAQK